MAEQLPHSEAILELFEDTNRPVGDAEAPVDDADRSTSDYPYTVIFESPTIWWRMQGPFNAPQADVQFIYSAVYVGLTGQQTRMLANRGRKLVSADNLIVPGYRIRDFRFEELGKLLRDDDLRPPVFTISDLYLLDTSPTG